MDDLNSEKTKYDPITSYIQSKLCNVLFTRELAKRLANSNVNAYALHPGVIKTEIGRNLKDSYGILGQLASLVFCIASVWLCKSTKQGAQTTIYCALSSELNNVSGKYYSDCKEHQLLPKALNEQDALKLWEISEKLTNLSQ